MLTGELTIEDAASEAAGNWQRFDSFCWFRRDEVEDPENWAIFCTSHRGSGLLDQSNAAAIVKVMQPFTDGDDPDVVFESHSHCAVGHIDGFSIRVFRNAEITDAFAKYHELTEELADYPILDEEDYSQRECEATFENLTDAAWRLKDEYDLPEDWKSTYWTGFPTTTAVPSKTSMIKAVIPMRTNCGRRLMLWNTNRRHDARTPTNRAVRWLTTMKAERGLANGSTSVISRYGL